MRIVIVLIVIILGFSNSTFGEEALLKGEYSFSAGYNFISKDKNPDLVSEYSNLSSSPVFLLDFADLAGHHKYSGDVSFFNRDDLNFNLQYDFKDVMRLEIRKNDFFHNISYKNFSYTNDYVDYKPNANYFADIAKNNIFFKVKPTNYPYHLRFFVEELDKKGEIQKRFYGRSRLDGMPLDYNIYSTSKKYDLNNEFYQFSLDGIVGGVNFLILLEIANLKDKSMDNSEGGPLLVFPSLTKNNKHFAIYSNQTGQLTYALSFTNSEINNNKRDELNQKTAEFNYNNSTAIITYYPIKDLKIYLKMRYEDKEENSPASIRFLNIDYPTKNQIPSTSATLLYGLVYNLTKNWRFKYEGMSKEKRRSNVVDNEWLLSNSLCVEGRISKTQLKIRETIDNIQNPYYKDTPRARYKTNFYVSSPVSDKSTLDFDYSITRLLNDDKSYYIQEGLSNSLVVSYHQNFENNLDLLTYVGFDNDRYKFDINVYGGGNIPNTPYKSIRLYGDVVISKNLTKKYNAYGDIFYQRVYGNYYPDISLLNNEITQIDYYQYGIKLGNNLKIGDDQKIKLELSYSKHTEKSLDSLSGDIKNIYIAWEKKW